ncbi:MAG: S41 family peptidase [Roseivirga sp.]
MLRSFFLLFLTVPLIPGLRAQNLNETQVLEDITVLQTNLERFHAGLSRFTPADSLDYYFELVKSRLGDEQQVVDFYKEITFLLNKVRCGHTRSSMPTMANDGFKSNHLFLPVSVVYLEDKLYIDDFLTNEGALKKGEEILTINGLSVKEINRRIFDHHSSDGFINSSKYRLTERYFRYYYQLYVSPDTDRYALTIRGLDGQLRRATIYGENWDNLKALDRSAPERAVLNLVHHNDYSYMKIGTFVSYYLNNAGLNYNKFLENSFRQLKEKGVSYLVLDLRGNGGGDDNYGALLVSYFADRAFRYFERIEVTDDYMGYGSVSRSGGRNLMTSHKGLSLWQPQANRFEGKVYVLTDGWSFSTCADVATVLHHHKWATFLGEETGGGYDGNTSGNSQTLTLPHSGISINLPMWMYTTANAGHKFYGRGVLPDYRVVASPRDFIEGKDVVLAKVEGLIGRNN